MVDAIAFHFCNSIGQVFLEAYVKEEYTNSSAAKHLAALWSSKWFVSIELNRRHSLAIVNSNAHVNLVHWTLQISWVMFMSIHVYGEYLLPPLVDPYCIWCQYTPDIRIHKFETFLICPFQSNDLFSLFLDGTMSYSCALFEVRTCI